MRAGQEIRQGDGLPLIEMALVGETREKLTWLEQQFEAARRKPEENVRAQEWTLRSLKQMINQMKEEITRFETRNQTPARQP